MGELIFMALTMLVSVLGFIQSFSWPVIPDDTSGGAALTPRIILVGLFICCLIRCIELLRNKEALRKQFVFLDLFYSHRGFFLLFMVLYAASIQFLGFLIATILFLNLTVNVMYYFAKGNLGKPAFIAVRTVCLCAAAVGTAWFFGSVLRIMVPTGIFGI